MNKYKIHVPVDIPAIHNRSNIVNNTGIIYRLHICIYFAGITFFKDAVLRIVFISDFFSFEVNPCARKSIRNSVSLDNSSIAFCRFKI